MIFTIILIASGCIGVFIVLFLCYFLFSNCINASADNGRYDCEKTRSQPPTAPSISYSEVLNERSRHPVKEAIVLPEEVPFIHGRGVPVLPTNVSRHLTPHTNSNALKITVAATLNNRDTTTVKVPKAAIKKHIYPDCSSDRQAEQFSVKRNMFDPTELNTVFKVNPQEFHYDLLHGKEVSIFVCLLNLIKFLFIGSKVK